MRRFLTIALFALAAMVVLGLQRHSAIQAPGIGGTPEVGGACGCPKGTPVCCLNCNGSFAYCARSHAFCPECPAP